MSAATLLFDLDGTLVDTDELHFHAFRDTMAGYGITVTHDYYKNSIMGFPNAQIMAGLMPGHPRDDHDRIAEEKEALFRTIATTMQPMPGLLDLLDWADLRGLPTGVVTNAPRDNATLQLTAIGLAGRFRTVVISYELARPKPDPLPYLTGLERLGGAASRSVAFEDSLSGMRAALGAGLPVVGVATTLPPEKLIAEGAALAIRDFTDPRLIPFVEERIR